MRIRTVSIILIGCGLVALGITPSAQPADAPIGAEVLSEAIARIAKTKGTTVEETFKARSEKLDRLFGQYIQASGGKVTGPLIRSFNKSVKQGSLTCFDDFLAVTVSPLRYIKDPDSGDRVPVFGPLGTDIINPWLAAMGICEGKPLAEQPMYKLASQVLREHIDFSVIGTKDPNLSFALLPPELRENAKWAYRRVNPTNRFDGGFDQPLFYITIREAAKKLFREDYPGAKLTMADVVVPVDEGGFGIRSCLLCHNRDHAGVYARLLGQSLLYQAKIETITEDIDASPDDLPLSDKHSKELKHAKAKAAMFQLAADRILKNHRDKIDPAAVREALGPLSVDNLNRLKPGFNEFYETLDQIGCTMCHCSSEQPPPEKNPAKFNAFVLTPNNYFKTKNIVALSALINVKNIEKSKLLVKAGGEVNHRGKDDMDLGQQEIQQLQEALQRWVHSLDVK